MTPERAELARELAVAEDAADAAATILKQRFLRPARRTRKGRHDVVTDVDLAAERAIMARIREAFPADSRVGEESGTTAGAKAGRTWLVDPLDGTINYASGIPWFCVSIALVVDGEVVVGVVADPLRDERFVGTGGLGAWHEPSRDPLRMRRIARVADAVVAADPGDPAEDDADRADGADARIGRLRPQVRVVRTLGSTALSLAYLAAGRLDGVLQVTGLQGVDVAAGSCLASLAGARVTASGGGPWLHPDGGMRGDGIAAGGPAVHTLLIGGHRRQRVDSRASRPVASGR